MGIETAIEWAYRCHCVRDVGKTVSTHRRICDVRIRLVMLKKPCVTAIRRSVTAGGVAPQHASPRQSVSIHNRYIAPGSYTASARIVIIHVFLVHLCTSRLLPPK
jgi:hypothetical protein